MISILRLATVAFSDNTQGDSYSSQIPTDLKDRKYAQ